MGEIWFDNTIIAAPYTTALCLSETLRDEWLDTGNLTVICQSNIEDSELINKIKIAVMNIAYPVKDEVLLIDTPFCGIKGAAHLLQRLWNTYIKSIIFND